MRADLMLALRRVDGAKKASRVRDRQNAIRARSQQRDTPAEASGCATTEEFIHATAAQQSHIVELLRPTQQDQCAARPHESMQLTPVRHSNMSQW